MWTKKIKKIWNFGRHFPALYSKKSSSHVRACAALEGEFVLKTEKIVPYHRDSQALTISVPDYGSWGPFLEAPGNYRAR